MVDFNETDAITPLAQCEVTGKYCAPEDLVDFMGKRVCEEGKEILLDRARRGVGEEGYTVASFKARLGAYIIDGIVVTLVSVPFLIVPRSATAAGWVEEASADAAVLSVGVEFVHSLITFFYHWLLVARYGRTLGKRLLNLRVLGPGDKVVTNRAAFIRSATICGVDVVLSPLGTLLENQIGFAELAFAVLGIQMLYLFANFVAYLSDSQGRTLYDRFAGTRVVKELRRDW